MAGMPVNQAEPIDAVYTWVDGSDPAWRAKKRATLEALGARASCLQESAISDVRYRSRDELRYSLRSLERFAPFVRKVYLVTDHQRPDWLDVGHPSLELVFHEDLFPDPSHLPTFCSRAIECHLHRIRGLSERFLYFNDDVMLARPTTPADFFDDEGRCIIYLGQREVVWEKSSPHYDLSVNSAARNSSRLLQASFGYRIERRLDHVPYALNKSVLEEVSKRFPDHLERLSARPFRHPDSVTLTYSLAPHYGICTGTAVAVTEPHSTYIKVKKKRASSLVLIARLFRQMFKRSSRSKFLSINDSGELDNSWLNEAAIALFFRATYPGKSRFERQGKRRANTGSPRLAPREDEA